MTDIATKSEFGQLIEPATVRLERTLPGPIERVWSYLTDSDLRAQWLAAGRREDTPGAPVTLVWRNDDLSGGAEQRPADMPEQHSMACAVVVAEPPRRLVLSWGPSGSEVTFELEPVGQEVKLVLTHRRIPSHDMLLRISAGWHAHLDLLVARLRGAPPPAFWSNWQRLREEYQARLA